MVTLAQLLNQSFGQHKLITQSHIINYATGFEDESLML